MAHLYRSGTSIFKTGNNIYSVRDRFNYQILTSAVSANFNNVGGVVFDPNPANNRMFVSNRNANTVSVVNCSTLAITATITGFSAPLGMCWDTRTTNSNLFFVANYGNATFSIVNATTLQISQNVGGFGGSNTSSVNIDVPNNKIILSNYTSGTLSVINATTFAAIATIPNITSTTTSCVDPIAANNRWLAYQYNNGQIITINSTTMTEVSRTAVGAVPASGECIIFDPVLANNRVLTTGGSGVNLINATTLGLVSTITGFSRAMQVAVDPTAANNRMAVTQGISQMVSMVTQIAS